MVQVDRVRESPGVQKALNGMDQQLTWLQQHPQGKVLWSLGSKLAQGVRGAADAQGGAVELSTDVTVDELRRQLTSLQVMEAAEMDPCKFLVTPAWHALAAELMAFGSSQSSNDRIMFVIAAGSIISAHRHRRQHHQQHDSTQAAAATLQARPDHHHHHDQKQQQHGVGACDHQQLLRQLHLLSSDPTPGVRCAVAAVVARLLTQGAFLQDMALDSSSSTTGSLHNAGTDSTTASSTTSPSGSGSGGSAGGGGGGLGSICSGSSPPMDAALGAPLQCGRLGGQQETPGCSGGGASGITSSSVAELPTTAVSLLQDCLQRLQTDPCVSVAELARAGLLQRASAAGGGLGGDVAAVAAAALAGMQTENHLSAGVGAGPQESARPVVAAGAPDLL